MHVHQIVPADVPDSGEAGSNARDREEGQGDNRGVDRSAANLAKELLGIVRVFPREIRLCCRLAHVASPVAVVRLIPFAGLCWLLPVLRRAERFRGVMSRPLPVGATTSLGTLYTFWCPDTGGRR